MDSISTIENKSTFKSLVSDFKQLTKIGLSLSVVFSAVAGYLLAADIIEARIKVKGVA